MGRPATVTGVEAILAAEKISRIMEGRFCGVGFRQIAAAEGISAATACRWYWRTMVANPPSRRRQLAMHRRLAALDGEVV